MSRCLIVFAREPRAGRVKSRLRSALSAGEAAAVYTALLRRSLEAARGCGCERRILFYTGASRPEVLRRLGRGFDFHRQYGTDLGERMWRAFRHAERRGADRSVLIGTDCPGLTRRDLDEAFRGLADHDLVLGPGLDGGYYLIGLRRPRRGLFEGISWGGPEVFGATLEAAYRARMRVFRLAKRGDVDTPEDLARGLFEGGMRSA